MTNKAEIIIWQQNLQHSKAASLNLAACCGEISNYIILIQEPYVVATRVKLTPLNTNIHYTGNKPRACVVTSKELKTSLVTSLSNDDVTCVKLKTSSGNILLISAYCDIKNIDVIPKIYHDINAYANTNNLPIVWGLDTNAHSPLWGSETSNKRGEAFEDWIADSGLHVINDSKVPTFDCSRAQTIIDVTLCSTNIYNNIKNWKVNPDDQLSDHKRIEMKIQLDLRYTKIEKINFRKTNWECFTKEVEKLNFQKPTYWSKEYLNYWAEKLNKTIKKGITKACPKTFIKDINIPGWWTNELQLLRKRVRFLGKVCKTDPKKVDDWKTTRSKYSKALKKAKKEFWRKKCTDPKDIKDVGEINKILQKASNKQHSIEEINVPNKSITNSEESLLNHLFDIHFPGSKQPQKTKSPTTTSTDINPNFIYEKEMNKVREIFLPIKIKAAINKFSPYKTAGPDDIKPIVLRHLPEKLVKLLSEMFSASVLLGFVPDIWLDSIVKYIPKPGKDDYTKAKSYRPISLSSYLIKTMERLVLWHLEDTNLKTYPLSKHQHAFCRNKGTDTALCELVDKIESALLRGQYAVGVFLDIQGAFDNLDTNACVQSMLKRGFDPSICQWYEYYLKNRTATANYGDATVKRLLTKGTPQGGVMSPLSWNVPFDELLVKVNKEGALGVGFADDLAIVVCGLDPQTIIAKLQNKVNEAVKWGEKYKLNFNPSKTVMINFTNKRSWNCNTKLKIKNQMIEFSNETNYLGVILDKKLSYKSHINKSIAKAKMNLMRFKNTFGREWGLKPHLLAWVYKGCILPKILYGCHIWAHKIDKNKTLIKKFNKLNRLALKMMCSTLPSTPTAGLEVILDLWPIKYAIKNRACTTMLRIKNKIPKIWDGVGKIGTGHIRYWENQIDLNCTLKSFDSNQYKRIWSNNFEECKTENCNCCTPNKVKVMCYIYNNTDSGTFAKIDNRMIYKVKSPIGIMTNVYQSKLYETYHLLSTLVDDIKVFLQDIIIVTDTKNLFDMLSAKEFNSIAIAECKEKLNRLGELNKIRLKTVKSLTPLGNDGITQKLQKVAYCEPFMPLSYNEIKTKIEKRYRSQWEKDWQTAKEYRQTKIWFPKLNKIESKLILQRSRFELGLIIQFITGHNHLHYHRSKCDDNVDDKCRLCQEGQESSWHIAAECPALTEQRKAIFKKPILSQKSDWTVNQIRDLILGVDEVRDLMKHPDNQI